MKSQFEQSTNLVYQWSYNLLSGWGVPDSYLDLVNLLFLTLLVFTFIMVVTFISRKILLGIVPVILKKTTNRFDDYMLKNRAFLHLARIIPLILTLPMIPVILSAYPQWEKFVTKIFQIILVIGWAYFFRSIFRSIRDQLGDNKAFADKPLDSYMQVVNIILFIIATIIAFTIISGIAPMKILGTMGAASAILLLVFRDTILGFVASIQVATNDMVRIGDWIEMPKYGADGQVLEINLNTVKIQNWDKSVSTVPTHFLVSDSFKNWRSMVESGGRRIKRAINIKISTIRFLKPEELNRLREIHLISHYIAEKQQEIEDWNQSHDIKKTLLINGRNLTNVGIFRQYISQLLQHHPLIKKDMAIMVRQLSPNELGLPIELYMFAADTRWANYEEIMSDIFDHLLAAVSHFNLEIFESPASDDIRGFINKYPVAESN